MEDANRRALEFGRRLREVRERTGESLRDVQARCGLNSGYLSQLENGKITNPSPSILQRVATGYGLRFEDVLTWTGYVTAPEGQPSRNQAVAMSTVSALGDPSDEELETLKAIVQLLQSKRTATYEAPSDLPLDAEATGEIRRYALAILREADALGERPTPLADIQAAARLVMAGEITLDAKDRERLHERFGHWVNRAWKRLQGTFDFRASAIWVAPDLHEMKRRFVVSHEIGHAILPAHKQTFAYIDDFTRLPPFARDLFEREANQAAVEILFQGEQGTDEFDSSPPTLDEVCNLSSRFGASVVASARYAAETSRRSVAVAIAHRSRDGRLGPTHIYASAGFRSAFEWCTTSGAPANLRTALQTADTREDECWVVTDRRGEPRIMNVEKMYTGYAAILLAVPESRTRAVARTFAAGARNVIATTS